MLVEFLCGDTVAAKPLFIETKRVVGLSWGDFYNGRPATWVELDNGDRIKVRGDMQDTVARINYATQHQPKEASMDSIERQYRMSDAPDNIACLKCKALQEQLAAAERERDAALKAVKLVTPVRCGSNPVLSGVGCGEFIPTETDLYRCLDCGTPFHKKCLEEHCSHNLAMERDARLSAESRLFTAVKALEPETVEKYIATLPWHNPDPDLVTMISGNIRAFAAHTYAALKEARP